MADKEKTLEQIDAEVKEEIKDDVSNMIDALRMNVKPKEDDKDKEDKDDKDDKDKDKDDDDKDLDKDDKDDPEDDDPDSDDDPDDDPDDPNDDEDDPDDNDPDKKDDDDPDSDDPDDDDPDDKDKDKDKDDKNSDPDDDPDDPDNDDDDGLSIEDRLKIAQAEVIALKTGAIKPVEDVKIDADPVEMPVVDFIGDQDMDELMTDKGKLNELLNKAAVTGYQQAMKTLPSLTVGLVDKRTKTNDAVREFYTANPDLVKMKDYVSSVATQLQNQYPTLDTSTLFKLTANTVRKTLGLKKKVDKIEKKSKKKKRDDNKDDKTSLRKKSTSGGKSDRRNKKDARTDEQKSMDAMLKVS